MFYFTKYQLQITQIPQMISFYYLNYAYSVFRLRKVRLEQFTKRDRKVTLELL